MKKINKKILSIIILFLMTIVSLVLIKPVIKNINYGLDLKGGFEVLYEVSPLKESDTLTDDMLISTYKAINNRVDSLGVSEPIISIEGSKIRVQLPGVKDESAARERLSTPAVLTFRSSTDELLMTSSVLNSPGASVDYNETGRAVVALSIKDNDTFYKVTKRISESEENLIVIWLDFDETIHSYDTEREVCGKTSSACISSATVKEAFSSNVVIEGNFTEEEARNLVDLINSGSLPTKLTEVSTKTVDASLGTDMLIKAALAGVITLIIITIIMTYFYRLSGFISSICLLFYTILVFAFYNAIDGVLTLTGIAALILGIGMAVDSSVVTLEKIKDELRSGKKILLAFKNANKKSLTSLIDANITTLIVAIVLFIFGESAVKGFGSMLTLTIIVTMITMVFINRFLLGGFINDKTNINFFIGPVSTQKPKKFMKHSLKLIILLLIIFVLSGIFTFVNKVNLGVDFLGGTNITVTGENVEEEVVLDMLKDYEVNKINTEDNTTIVTLKNALDENEIKNLKSSLLEEGYTSDISVISNIVKKDLTKNAIISVIIAFVGILIYVSVRFKFNYALASIIAILIDVLSIISVFIFFKLEVNFILIASILTIIGYSINDTIVIFDLIRENKKNNKDENNEELIDSCLTKVLKRSIITTFTTLIAVITLLILGASGIKEFNIAILTGLITGVASSLYIAPYIWMKLEKRERPKKEDDYDDGPEEKLIKGINS